MFAFKYIMPAYYQYESRETDLPREMARYGFSDGSRVSITPVSGKRMATIPPESLQIIFSESMVYLKLQIEDRGGHSARGPQFITHSSDYPYVQALIALLQNYKGPLEGLELVNNVDATAEQQIRNAIMTNPSLSKQIKYLSIGGRTLIAGIPAPDRSSASTFVL